MVAGGFHRLLDQRKVSYDGSCPSAAQAIILAACDFLTQCDSHHPSRQDQGAFEPLIDAAMVRTIRGVLKGGVRKSSTQACLSPELIAASASGAIYGAVKEWSVTPNRPAAEEIVPMVLHLVLPILQSACPPPAEPETAERTTMAGA
jgi:hypothetical protein